MEKFNKKILIVAVCLLCILFAACTKDPSKATTAEITSAAPVTTTQIAQDDMIVINEEYRITRADTAEKSAERERDEREKPDSCRRILPLVGYKAE